MVIKGLHYLSSLHRPWFLGRFRRYRDRHKKKANSAEGESLPHSIRFGYSMGHVLNDLCASMWFTYSLLFYTAVVGFSHSYAGGIMMIGQIADALATPIVGALSDHSAAIKMSQSRKFGKRKGWYILGTIVILCTKPFMFSPCFPCRNASDYWRMSYYAIFIVLFQFGWAAVQTIHLAMVSDLTPYDRERTVLLSLRNTMTAICNSVTYIGQWITIATSEESGDRPLDEHDMINFQIVVASIVILGFGTSILFLVIVPEDPLKFRVASVESSYSSTLGQSQSLKETLSKWQLHYIGVIYMNTRLFVVGVQALLTLYLHESLHLYAYELATVPLVLNIACFLASLSVAQLNDLFGRKMTFGIGSLFGLSASAWTYFGRGDLYRHGMIYLVGILYGTATALLQITALALVADHIGEDINSGGFIYGYMSFLDKVSTGLMLAVILHFHQSTYQDYFTYAVVGICGFSIIIGLVFMVFHKVPPPPQGSDLNFGLKNSIEINKKGRTNQNTA